MTDEQKLQEFLKESPKRKSEIYRGLLETQSNQMTLNSLQKEWVQDAINFHDEEFFAFLGKNFPIVNYEEFRKTEIMMSYEQLHIRKNGLFAEDQARKFCLDSTLTSISVKANSVSSANESNIGFVSCTCLSDTLCSTGCNSKTSCATGGCTSGLYGCGCLWHVPCTGTCG